MNKNKIHNLYTNTIQFIYEYNILLERFYGTNQWHWKLPNFICTLRVCISFAYGALLSTILKTGVHKLIIEKEFIPKKTLHGVNLNTAGRMITVTVSKYGALDKITFESNTISLSSSLKNKK